MDDDADDPAGGATPEPAPRPRSFFRRYWWLWTVLAVVLAGVVTLAVVAAMVVVDSIRAGERADRRDVAAARACGELETRLNRLTPPGATKGPGQRAAAIRAENAATAPFLAELDGLDQDRGGRWRGYVSAWHGLVDARAGYAAALDLEASGSQRAFFLLPRAAGGRSAVDVLSDEQPRRCDGVLRRLAHPDL